MRTQIQPSGRRGLALLALWALSTVGMASAKGADVDRLVTALLGDTPLIEDLRQLTDEIGGRPDGSEANRHSVEWAMGKFKAAGLEANKEPYAIQNHWSERSTHAELRGDVLFPLPVVAMAHSAPTPEQGLVAPLLDGGTGTEADFARLGDRARNALVLVETSQFDDLEGLFEAFKTAYQAQLCAEEAQVAGLIFVSSRPPGQLYRQGMARGKDNRLRALIVEREAGMRLLRLLRAGHELELLVKLDVQTHASLESHNVIAEIKGHSKPEEIILIGAHLDSWDLGQGALDNGCNVAMLIDIARQMKRLGIQAKRTIRFCLFNGEETGFQGSWAYTVTHQDELDQHVLAQIYDTGSGRITGFFINGRTEMERALERALQPVKGLGPFEHISPPVFGTDNLDFMLQGVANLVAIQEFGNYGVNYHTFTDTFDKVDQRQLRLNAAIAAVVTWSFAEMPVYWKRHSRQEVQDLIDTTELGDSMRESYLMESWDNGERGLPRRGEESQSKSSHAPKRQDLAPIIDMHVHAQDENAPEDRYGNKRSPDTQHLFKETYRRFRKYNIVKAVVSGDLENMDYWKAKDEDDRIIRGIFMNEPHRTHPAHEEMNPELFESLVKAGKIEVFGELGCIYGGSTLSDPEWQPYLEICEQYDIPVSVHTGAGGENMTSYFPAARLSLGAPYLIEDALVKYPKLRVYIAHAGQEWYERAVMLMRIYPNLYTDLGVVLWWSPLRKGYGTQFLRRAKEAKILDRVMFGSDQMMWPHGIDMSIEYLNSLEFLTEREKRDIFYNNAARFLKLDEQ